MSAVPSYISFSFIAIVAVMYSTLVMGVFYARNRAGDTSPIPNYVMRFCVGGFLLVTGFLALQGFFADFNTIPPRIAVAAGLGLGGAALFAFHRKVGQWLQFVPQSWIIAAQTFRLFVEVVLFFLATTPVLSKLMTFEGRNFDILIGVTAPILAFYVHKKKKTPEKVRGLVVGWNIAGMVILANTVFHGIFSTPSPMRLFDANPPTTAIGFFPYVWLPAYLVPYAFLLHFLSLRKASLEKQKQA